MAKYKSDINLFDCIFKDKTKKAINLEKELKKYFLLFAAIAAGAAVVGGVAVGVQSAALAVVNGNISKLRSEHDFDEIANKKAEMERKESDNQKIKDELANFKSTIQFKSELLGYIAAAQPSAPDVITIHNVNYGEGRINMDCTGNDELTIARFVNRLREENEVFSDVSYTGVAGNEGGMWNATVNVVIRDKAQEEAEAEAAAAAAAAEAAAAAAEAETGEA